MLNKISTIYVATALSFVVGPAWAQSPLERIISLVEAKTIFVSSIPVPDGNLGGLAGADAFCQSLADGPGSIVPEGKYVALLSTDDVNVSARITPTSAPYIRPDGRFVASNAAELFVTKQIGGDPPHDALINPINVDETGQDVGFVGVWTGTEGNTSSAFANCVNWTSDSAADFGHRGHAGNVDFIWLGPPLDATACNQPLGHLYCVKH